MSILALTIFQGMVASLGVGASTIAIVNFFVAIWDGKIDEHERKMMGVVYIILRIVMVLLLLTSITFLMLYYASGTPFSIFFGQVWTLLAILYTNAILMTYKKMPSAFGPAIQASAWYTLGVLNVFHLSNLSFSYGQFVMLYLALCLLAVSVINTIMMYLRHKQDLKK